MKPPGSCLTSAYPEGLGSSLTLPARPFQDKLVARNLDHSYLIVNGASVISFLTLRNGVLPYLTLKERVWEGTVEGMDALSPVRF